MDSMMKTSQPGSSHAWLVLGGLAGLATLQPMLGCGTTSLDTGTTATEVAVVFDLLADVGPQVILPTLDRFLIALDTVDQTLEALDLEAGQDNDARAAAQSAFVDALLIWQELEVMQIGPAASSLSAIAGENLRDEIYSWPTVNACRVDQVTSAEEWEDKGFFEATQVNAYGLDALDYLLHAAPESECPTAVTPISDGLWDTMGELGVAANRANLALSLAGRIRAEAERLREKWAVDGENFSGQLAMNDSSPYSTTQEALNAVFDGLFYLETMTKDTKLAAPIAQANKGELAEADEIEGLWSETGLEAIAHNLIGFELLFTGGEGIGFDDLLVELGHADLSDQILVDLETAVTAAGAVEAPLAQAVTDYPEQVQALHAAVKNVTDVLKGDLATVLSLQIPSEAAGDND